VFWCICTCFQTTRNFFFKKDIFERLECLKCVCMHLRTFPDHQKHFFKNDFFDLQECLKTCFDAFAHTSRPPVTFFQ
jgi:hypothetical protein